MKKITILLLVFITVSSCKKEEPLTFSETNFTSEEHAIIEVNIPKFEGNPEVARTMNNAIESFVVKTLSNEEYAIQVASIKEASEAFDSEYIKFSKEFSEASPPWEVFIDGEVTYQSSEIISVAINSYTNTGGAHGNSVISFLNFNPSSGKTYRKENLLSSSNNFKAIVEKYFKKEIEEMEDVGSYDFLSELELPGSFGFSEDGVIILYNNSELSTFDSRMIEFTIPFEEVNEFLKVH